MKKWIILFMVAMHICSVQAQTLEEWTQQKEMQKKYLVQQIAALKVFLNYAAKGYTIAREGLQTIHQIKGGDFNLHEAFFNGLALVNPAISHSAKVAAVLVVQGKILRILIDIQKHATAASMIMAAEQPGIRQVCGNISKEVTFNLSLLISNLTDGELQLADDERFQNIDTIYNAMTELYAFAKSLQQDVLLVGIQRKHAVGVNQFSKLINGAE